MPFPSFYAEKPPLGTPINRSHQLAKGIVFDQIFNEGAGAETIDGSGFNNHGAMVNCAWAPRGIDFNGSTSYIKCGNKPSLNPTKAITIEVRVKWDVFKVSEVLTKGYTGSINIPWRFHDFGSGNFGFYLVNSSGTSKLTLLGGGLSTGTGYDFVGVYDGDNIIPYKNGVQGTLVPQTGDISTNALDLYIGYRWGASYFNGTIQLARIWERALPQSEISWLHREPFCMYETPTIEEGMLYYPFNPAVACHSITSKLTAIGAI